MRRSPLHVRAYDRGFERFDIWLSRQRRRHANTLNTWKKQGDGKWVLTIKGNTPSQVELESEPVRSIRNLVEDE